MTRASHLGVTPTPPRLSRGHWAAQTREAAAHVPDGNMSLTYIIGTYPLLTTTFIDREITVLRRWGVDVQIVAIRRPAVDTPLSDAQRELQKSVVYLLPIAWLDLTLSHMYFVVMRPRRYFHTLASLLTRSHPTVKSRIKTLLHFGEGVYAAYLVRHRAFRELHGHFADRAATVALVAGRLLDKPYSLSIHAGADVFVAPLLLREKIMGARHVVTCTLHNKTHLASLVGQDLGSKITPIRHGLNLGEYRPAPRPAKAFPMILSVGQLAERKGFAQLIRSCRRLRDQGYRFRCRIVGRGPQHEELQRLINQSSLEDVVTLCGALRHERVIEQYRQATMFVLPCIRTKEGDVDGIPNVLAEAMALQVPVISTDLPAIRELVSDRISGLLVPSGDDAALTAAMSRLLDQPALGDELGRRGRQAVLEMFDGEANVRRFAATLWPDWFPREAATA